MANRVRVAVNGYGVIGKRVADAVYLQDDMDLIGVSDVTEDYRIRVAAERGYPIYASVPERRSSMEDAGIPVDGTLQDLLREVDVVVDCTPKGIGAKNKPMYEEAGVRAIFQGGEKHELAGVSFTAQVNYGDALNKQFARVVSCNTTGLCRVLNPFQKRGWVKRARAVLMRRATDPWESQEDGMINTAVPETKVPSHQGPDAQTVMKDLDITTLAGAGPYNLSHLHFLMIETSSPLELHEVRQALVEEPRIAFIHESNGIVALNSTIELMRDLNRPRNDMWEVGLWEDAIAVDEHDVYLTFQVHNESIAIPENVDCIRSLTGIETNGMVSIDKTNIALGIVKNYLPVTMHDEALHEAAQEMEAQRRVHMEMGFKGREEPAEAEPTPEQEERRRTA
ncbi:MAG: type II glyceraldehyde-3-phosphate dehydrogenase [Actinobacteria bacterium]|nr:MAG: type II glyceraldehyde-3-phosphate dehydrogenase [Actinomycetota bacterium]